MKNTKFEKMVRAIEEANEKELQYLIAKQEKEKAIEAYKKSKTIYCGTEEQVYFFEQIVEALELDIAYQVIDVDGELEVRIID